MDIFEVVKYVLVHRVAAGHGAVDVDIVQVDPVPCNLAEDGLLIAAGYGLMEVGQVTVDVFRHPPADRAGSGAGGIV